MNIYGPAWVEVDLDALRFNIRSCKTFAASKMLAVVKADAYGHGAIEVAKIMEEEGVDYLGVATIFEALELRQHNIKLPILVFTVTPNEFVLQAIENDITLTVCNVEMARYIEFIGMRLNCMPKIHIKINTGMNRLGIKYDNINVIASICRMQVNSQGIYTHFAMADAAEFSHTDMQANRYLECISKLSDLGFEFEIKHMCNSAAMMREKKYHLDMVRAGGILYGHFCLGHLMSPIIPVKRVMSIRAVLSHISDLDQDEGVSYGWLYKTTNKVKIGVLPIGYTDGISRRNTNNTSFLLAGKRVRQVGLICMDQMMIDVTDVKCEVGDIVTLLGEDGHEISLEERASDAGIGKCELFAGIGRRLPKVYFVKGQHNKIVNNLLQ